MPSEAADLRKQLDDYLAAVDAQLPVINPAYDPKTGPADKQKTRLHPSK